MNVMHFLIPVIVIVIVQGIFFSLSMKLRKELVEQPFSKIILLIPISSIVVICEHSTVIVVSFFMAKIEYC